jgi:putative membrane protein
VAHAVHSGERMTNLKTLSTISLLALLVGNATAACSSDDDDTTSAGGRAGTSNAGAADTEAGAGPAEGGSPGGHNLAGAPNGGETGGASAAGGQAGAAGENANAGAGGASAVLALSDAQVLLVLDTVNQGEVEEAYAALPRLTSPDVEAFAQKMVADHSAARQSVVATADSLNVPPAPSDVQAELKTHAEDHVALLRSTATAALDATYVDLEVEGHAEALMLLDELAAAANAAELKTLIATLRTTVVEHYDRAQELQTAP